MLTSILSRINKVISVIEKRRKKLKCLIFRCQCNDKIRLFCSPELYYIICCLCRKKSMCLYQLYCSPSRVHRNKLTVTFINNINGVIKKNVSLFFFPPDIELARKAKQKQRDLIKNQLFLISLLFL